ncbi:MAG: hypothetical protein HY675_01800 [Chloroflexi bacterium]|nr:hypothetical protein [Chloroflexota bacterium]
MLLTSLALGQVVAWRVDVSSLYLWLLAIAVFVVREPLALLWRAKRADTWSSQILRSYTAGVLGAIALLAAVLVATRGVEFLFLATPAAVLFALQLTWQRTKARWSWQAELLGTAGVTIAAPAAYFAATGALDRTGLSLWAMLFAYFAAQVVYVRWRLRSPGDRVLGFVALGIQALMVAAFFALGFATWVPSFAFVAFAPGIAKTLLAMGTGHNAKKQVTRLGWVEVAYSLAFVLLTALAYRLA